MGWADRAGASKVRTYSHGMRARLALAQALLPQPELLILDEPSDGLDPEGIHEMRQTILRLHRELGLTILLSSHFLNEVEQLCTRIAVLNQGRKVFEGTLAETKQRQKLGAVESGRFSRLRRAQLRETQTDHGSSATAQFIALKPGDRHGRRCVKLLVSAGMPVYEIAHEEETLEEFLSCAS